MLFPGDEMEGDGDGGGEGVFKEADGVSELEETVRRIVREELARQEPAFQDSVEMGSPTKGGALKVYFNAGDVGQAKMRVDNAVEVRDHMGARLAGTEPITQPRT
jgi:hypothetical protein